MLLKTVMHNLGCLCCHHRCRHISHCHCCHRNCHCRPVIAGPLFCPPPHSVIHCMLMLSPLVIAVSLSMLLPTHARLCRSHHRLVVVCLFLPRMGGLGPSSAPSIQRTRPTLPRCHSKNALLALRSCDRRRGYPCTCKRPIQAIPFTRCMYNWGDAPGGWKGVHAFV
jgi:hypothetical protein